MGKGKRTRIKRPRGDAGFLAHAREVFTRNFQEQIRKSELWPQMVAEFGEAEAQRLLRQCKAELRPGMPEDETGNRSEDI